MDHLYGLFGIAIPIVAIVGGISMGIVRILTAARLEELARKERIAAIERGVDPAKLPPVPEGEIGGYGLGYSRLRRAHGLLIGGLITTFVGVGTAIFVYSMEPAKTTWLVGLIPFCVGIALLLSARVVWPQETAGAPTGPR